MLAEQKLLEIRQGRSSGNSRGKPVHSLNDLPRNPVAGCFFCKKVGASLLGLPQNQLNLLAFLFHPLFPKKVSHFISRPLNRK